MGKTSGKVPIDEFNYLSSMIEKSRNLKIYLFDSGNEKLYEAVCIQICFHNGKAIELPEPDSTQEYYRNNHYEIWFMFSQKSDSLSKSNTTKLLHNYLYLRVNYFLLMERLHFQFL